ncbi:MAG TPA: hypothetical protein VK577_13000 [Bradyrhizobium sp.]|nr:hypothetical protein [Bradyrhizobium sp.]
MRSPVKERGSLVARHDFDSLSTDSAIEVRAARSFELSILADMAHRMVPGVQITEPTLRKYLAFDPECILTFSRQERLLGAIAFLYLDSRGHDALMLGGISLTHPDIGFLAGRNDEVSATYIWAIAATGRGIAGLGKAAAHLRTPRYVGADCFAQPSTAAGRDLLTATGFKPIPSFQPDLWCYERPWNRLPSNTSAVKSTRSFADARH